MKTADGFARLPTYTEIIDGMANGLGLVRNREEYLAELAQYDKRAALYTGSKSSRGLVEKILLQFCGKSAVFRHAVRTQLIDFEGFISELRSLPLHTDAPRNDGVRAFLDHIALPWAASALRDLDTLQSSPAWRASEIINEAERSRCTLLEAWKAHMKALIPPGLKVPEFRKAIGRATATSQRKIEGIEEDISNLADEISSSGLEAKDEFILAARNTYFAGMALMRFSCLVRPYIEEAQLVTTLVGLINAEDYSTDPWEEIQKDLGHVDPPSLVRYVIHSACWDESLFEAALAQARQSSSTPSLSHYLPALRAYKHISHDERELAMQQLQLVLNAAGHRQVGEIAEWAASMLIALHLHTDAPKTHLALNQLVRTRIDNLAQREEMVLGIVLTPFSRFSARPEVDTYTQHMLESINRFLLHPRAPGVEVPFLYLDKLDRFLGACFEVENALPPGSAGPDTTKLVLPGVAIPAYELLRDIGFYRAYLSTDDAPVFEYVDRYLSSTDGVQLSILKRLDPIAFAQDMQRYEGHRHRSAGSERDAQ